MTRKQPISTFEYQPLNSDQPTAIRILVLSGGCGDIPIESSILNIDLRAPPVTVKYEALSYEWKEVSCDDPFILVNSCKFQIRKNLYDVLIQLRFVDKDRYLWIDALCIDQTNHLERNSQVHIMQTIYRKAQRVILWLGPAKDDSDLAIEILQIMETSRIGERQIVESTNRNRKAWRAALLAFCQRSYWCRIWIMQEICLGQEYVVHCGDKSISGNIFDESFKKLTRSRDRGDAWNDAVKETLAVRHITIFRYWAQRGQLFRLGQCLNICLDDLIATEPRDFVYGIRGLVSDCGTDELVPDYQKSLKHVFFDTVPILERSSISSVQVASKLAKKLGLTEDNDVQLCLLEMEDGNYEFDKSQRTIQKDYPGGMRKRLQRRNRRGTGNGKSGKIDYDWELDPKEAEYSDLEDCESVENSSDEASSLEE
ncbi:578f0b2b-25d2-4097-b477-61c62db8bc09-CDS [Sclerotinia trifoliorum]|uniref:578f0b2b-25d2-4097-b477-61c62db8bc09-CDS n=1 Tax=Sclerotinia trifoliorum TaxID=28548 RepID=A0A8H2VZ80_9HELO|nr:578f0b2b-25d2-4097-b477-61c62db8bc09-CDS [Sclerotinia trifoliorum]